MSCPDISNGICTQCVVGECEYSDGNGDCGSWTARCEEFTCFANYFHDDISSDEANCNMNCPVVGGTCTDCSRIGTTSDSPVCTKVVCDTRKADFNKIAGDGCEVSCAEVTGGNCTACTSTVASGCTAVTCATNKFDNNGIATDGCESAFECATVTGGICTACNSAVASGCTAVTCATNKVDNNGIAADGCEASCATVTNGICTGCTTANASGCTTITCTANNVSVKFFIFFV